jgi:hypothetical protein
LKQLQTLSLFVAKVTDAGLKGVACLEQLQSLDLSTTDVTDAGLQELAGLKQLQSLELVETQVTQAGIRQLRRALPQCQVNARPIRIPGLGELP